MTDPGIDRDSRTLVFGELEVKVDYLQISDSLLFKTSLSGEAFIVTTDEAREVEVENFDGSEKYIVERLARYASLVWECEGFKAPEWIMAFCKYLVYRNTPEFIKNKAKGDTEENEASQEEA